MRGMDGVGTLPLLRHGFEEGAVLFFREIWTQFKHESWAAVAFLTFLSNLVDFIFEKAGGSLVRFLVSLIWQFSQIGSHAGACPEKRRLTTMIRTRVAIVTVVSTRKRTAL